MKVKKSLKKKRGGANNAVQENNKKRLDILEKRIEIIAKLIGSTDRCLLDENGNIDWDKTERIQPLSFPFHPDPAMSSNNNEHMVFRDMS